MSDDLSSTGALVPGPVTRLAVRTRDGFDLRAEICDPAGGPEGGDPVRAAVVVCHPHPLHGGSMYNNVVDALFEGLPAHGAAVLRFNFRGTSGSEGRHDHGGAERLDVQAALAEMADRHPGRPLLLCGYSFGADVSLASDHPALSGWLAVAPVIRVVERSEMVGLDDERPTWLLPAEHDQFRPPDQLAPLVADARNCTIVPIPQADHFFMVGLRRVVAAAAEALDSICGA